MKTTFFCRLLGEKDKFQQVHVPVSCTCITPVYMNNHSKLLINY